MKCHKARASLILLITLITLLISPSTIHSWSLHRVRPVIIRQAPQAYHHAPPSFPLRSPAESIRDQGTEMEGSDSHQHALYHDMMDQSASDFDTYGVSMMESQSVKGQSIKDGQSIKSGQQRMMIPMMMPQSIKSGQRMKSGQFQPARADPMMTSASEMQMPMMMPMPLTTAMHNQFMKGQQMMQQLMDQMLKMNPLSSMSSMSQSQPMMSMSSSPCGMSSSQPMMMGGGGGGGKGGFDLLGMLQQLSPMNFMQNLQSMFNSMRMSGMGIFGMMSPGSQMSGMQMNSPCMMGE